MSISRARNLIRNISLSYWNVLVLSRTVCYAITMMLWWSWAILISNVVIIIIIIYLLRH